MTLGETKTYRPKFRPAGSPELEFGGGGFRDTSTIPNTIKHPPPTANPVSSPEVHPTATPAPIEAMTPTVAKRLRRDAVATSSTGLPKWQCLYYFPRPHGQGAFLPGVFEAMQTTLHVTGPVAQP